MQRVNSLQFTNCPLDSLQHNRLCTNASSNGEHFRVENVLKIHNLNRNLCAKGVKYTARLRISLINKFKHGLTIGRVIQPF
ncbi:hypothetical protein D3C74_424160 [compost metagenome]